MKDDFSKRKCARCGKMFVMSVNHPMDWAYKWPRCNKGTVKYFCTWKCFREFVKEKEKPLAWEY